MPTIEENRGAWNEAYDWKSAGNEWSGGWGSTKTMWLVSIYPRIARHLPCRSLLEIAPGFGRVTEFLLPHAKQYLGVDLAEKCVAACRSRFADATHARFAVGDGLLLPMVESASVDFAFSWDSLVHADIRVMRSYAKELARVLRPGGVAFLHHSNLAAIDPASKAAADARARWRDPTVSAALVREAATAAGLHCSAQELLNWAASEPSDCFTTLQLPPCRDALSVISNHPDINAEFAFGRRIDSHYGETRTAPKS
jgi:SAM-dependent methyltransferase